MKGQVAQGQRGTGVHRAELHPVQDFMFSKLVLHQGQGEARAVNARAFEFPHQPGQRADVVLMPVGQHDAQQLVLDGAHRAEMRNDHVHAQMGVVRKHQPAVHHDHAALCFPELAVEADFAESPQGGNGKVRFVHACRRMLIFVITIVQLQTEWLPGSRPRSLNMPENASGANKDRALPPAMRSGARRNRARSTGISAASGRDEIHPWPRKSGPGP